MRKALRLAALCATAAAISMPVAVQAQASGVQTLLDQARYWQSRNRGDLANQAYKRVLAIDPGNGIARAALNGTPPAAAPAPKPVATKPAPAAPVVAPKFSEPAMRQIAALATPHTQPAAPAPTNVDRGGDARAAGFKALNAGDLNTAARQFQVAITRQPNDAEALGGLGIVKLRTEKFVEARDLLQRASRGGGADKWAQALNSASFFAGMTQGEAALDAGRFDEAQRIAEGLVHSDFADKSPAYGLLGGVYERQGRYDDAAQAYSRASTGSGKPDKGVIARVIRAQALAAENGGDTMGAERLFQQGTLADPSDPWMRYEYARFLVKQRRPVDAETAIGSLRGSTDPESLYAAALLMSQIDRPTDAEGLLDRIPQAARTPEMRNLALGLKVTAAIQRAKAIAGQGQTMQATSALRQLSDTPGIAFSGKAQLADALYDMGDSAGAALVAQRALSQASGDLEGYEPLVRVLAKTGQDAFALSAVQTATERAGASPSGQQMVAKLRATVGVAQADRLRQQGQFASAFELLQAQWTASPGNREILSSLARLYQSGGLNAQAAQTFQMLLAQSPSDKDALLGLVDTASAAGNFVQARAALERAIRLSPNDYNVYLAAGRMEQARGDEKAALRYMKRARELYSGQAAPVGGFGAGNPFTNMPVGQGSANPFAAAPQPQQQLNPFALGKAQTPAPAPFAAPFPAAAPVGGAVAPAAYMQSAPGGFGAQGPITDPVLAGIDRDMQAIAQTSGPRVDVDTRFRQRKGEEGLSQLSELGASAEMSTDFAGGRVSVKADAVALDAGQPTGSGLARFGTNGTAEAAAIVAKERAVLKAADTQHAAGVAVSVGYENELVKADVGTTPLGFDKQHVAAGIVVRPRLSRYSSVRLWAERRAVTDSVVSYAGTVDPVSGAFWGAVMKTGGGAGYSYDKDGNGFYVDGSYYAYRGTAVRNNNGIQANAGGYLRVYRDGESSVTVGLNANYQSFDNNQNYFTYGQGGYFSPQSFLSVSFPLRYAMNGEKLKIDASLVPGYQSYDQASTPLYPTEARAQSVLDGLKAQNNDVRAQFDSISKSGFGISASGAAWYQISPGTRIGGELGLNTFGDYNEFKSLLGIRQQLGGGN